MEIPSAPVASPSVAPAGPPGGNTPNPAPPESASFEVEEPTDTSIPPSTAATAPPAAEVDDTPSLTEAAIEAATDAPRSSDSAPTAEQESPEPEQVTVSAETSEPVSEQQDRLQQQLNSVGRPEQPPEFETEA